MDLSGNLYIAQNNVVRKVTAATGIITTVAGDGQYIETLSYGDGGPATSATADVHNVAVDAIGNLYLAGGSLVRKVTAATGIINTVAGIIGGGSISSGDDGPATAANLGATAVAVDPA